MNPLNVIGGLIIMIGFAVIADGVRAARSWWTSWKASAALYAPRGRGRHAGRSRW